MKSIFSTIFFLLIINLHGYSQTEKGSFLIGGSGNISWPRINYGGTFNLNISPQGGYFVADNLALGVKPSFGFLHGSYKQNSTLVGISPFIRYYIGKSMTRLFFQGDLGVAHSNSRSGDPINPYTNSYTTFYQDIGVGVCYFINKNIGLEGLLSYNHSNSSSVNSSNIYFNVGFQIYLQKKDKTKTEKTGE